MNPDRRSYWSHCCAWLVLWVLIGGVSCSSSSTTLGGLSPIGVVDAEQVLEGSALGKRVADALNSFMRDRQTLIDLEQKELRRMESELLRQGSVLSQKARQQREEEFRRRMAEYQQKVGDLNREVQEKQKEALDEFRSKVETVVAKVAGKRELSIVIEKGRGTSTLYNHPMLDITKDVLEELDRQFP